MNAKLLACAAATLAAPFALANILTNGGFETNSANTGFYVYFGDTADHWSVARETPDVWDNGGLNGNAPGTDQLMTGIAAYEGTKWAAMGGKPAFGEAMASDAVGLTSGKPYIVSAALIQDANNPLGYVNASPLDVYIEDSSGTKTLVGAFAANTGPGQWELRSVSFRVASSGDYRLVISNEREIASYIGVDDVRLEAVPEPATLVVLGLGAVALIRRRRQ